MDEQARYDQARRHVLELKGFYRHLAMYLLINAFLIGINLVTAPEELWFYWPLLGWGIGIIAHAVSVFGGSRFLGKDWEEKKIREFMDKKR
ncbi:MAG: 2TM domain-containing protein [Thermodesulfovibrionales bacterium]|jgi:uncharacterized membrane protein